MNKDVFILLSRLYYDNFSKMVSALIYHTGIKNKAVAEDIVQDAFTVASEKWKDKLPEQPEAWLFKTVRNLAYNSLRIEKNNLKFEKEFIPEEEGYTDEGYLLKLLFICIQPAFSPKVQLIIALRYARGFQVKRIAVLLGTDEDTVSKILYRWRMQNNSLNWDFSDELIVNDKSKTDMVLKILYVMFTEGYRLSDDGQLIDERLCEDAISLVMEMIKMNIIAEGKTKALYALMLYHLARSVTRINNYSELSPLAAQDKACWDRNMIAVANNYLAKSQQDSTLVNSYQIEAAIAYTHTSTLTFDKTDWLKIANLYQRLKIFNPSPFTILNQAVALYFGKETRTSINLLETLSESKFFRNYHVIHCFWGIIYHDQNEYDKALMSYQRALGCTINRLEEKFIKGKISEILNAVSAKPQ